jgi:hypothetical protein
VPAGRGSSGSALLGYNNRHPDWDAAVVGCKSEYMTDVVWQPLPPLWPRPAVSTDVGGFMLLVFSEGNVPTWEVRRKAKRGGGGSSDLVVGGAADTFEAAKAAALFEATARSVE